MTEQKEILPGWAQQVQKRLGADYTGKAKLDVERLLQALEAEMRKVERAKESAKVIHRESENLAYQVDRFRNYRPGTTFEATGLPQAFETLKELEE